MSKTDTIAMMAWDAARVGLLGALLRGIQKVPSEDVWKPSPAEAIAAAIAFYQLTDRMVTEAYSTKSTDLPKRDV